MNTPHSIFHTPGFAHYAVAWSPFDERRLAIASAANYGLIGNGRLHVVSLLPGNSLVSQPHARPAPTMNLDKFFPTQDGLYDLAWSELHENQLVSSSGDGSIRLWDITLNDLPIRIWQEHTREVLCVDWSNSKKDVFCSSSWDGTIKVWTPELAHSLITLQVTHDCVYKALFSPHHPDLIAACSSDGVLRLFDLRSPALIASAPSSLTTPISVPALAVPPRTRAEMLSLDWNKYRPLVLAVTSTDNVIRVWDCRMLKIPMGSTAPPESSPPFVGGVCESELAGHEYAVRDVQWSPHHQDLLASASYDMTCRVWSTNPPPGINPLRYIHDAHTEFVVGCSWSLFDEGLLASCAWDCKVHLFHV